MLKHAVLKGLVPALVVLLAGCASALMARIIRPGQMVTKEFDAERLNLEVDAAGRIVAVRCG